jgi:hypothetical protein
MLDKAHYPAFLHACEVIDTSLATLNVENLSASDYEENRAKFFATAFYDSFISLHTSKNYRDDQHQFYIDCKEFVYNLPFEARFKDCDGLVVHIQNTWWDKICEKAEVLISRAKEPDTKTPKKLA